MSKHLRTFLILTISIFSFLFIDKVNAITYNGVVLDDEFFSKGWEQVLENVASSSGELYHQEDFPYVFCHRYTSSSKGVYIRCYFLTDYYYYSHNSSSITLKTNTTSKYIMAPGFDYYIDSNTYVKTTANNFYLQNSFNAVTNFDVYDSNNTLIRIKAFDYNPSKDVNVTFHLNGGDVYNKNQVCDEISCELFTYEYNDFSVTLNSGLVYDYLKNLKVSKDMMIFKGWYYDNTFNNPLTENDVITSDINLYAKYEYESVDDFLKNTTFNSHTFNTEYDYAIISKGDYDGDIYLGLDFASYSLEIYEYRPYLNSYKDGPTVCLTPVYIKDNKYYYNVNALYTNNYEIFILPRSVFENIEESTYNFLLTNNAYVNYTNDLTNSIIIDENGIEISTNLKDSYELGQSYLNEYNNTDSNFNIMKKYLNELKSMNSVWNECFNLFYSSLPGIVRYFMIFVFNIIMILIFLKLVGWK